MTADEVSLADFSFIRPLAIGILATRVKKQSVRISNPTGPAASFLSRIGFYSYLALPDPFSVTGRNLKTIELQSCLNVETAIEKASALLPNRTNRRTIELIMTEIFANVDMHANAEGLVVGQVIQNRMELAIVDDGIGIHSSLCQNPIYATVSEEEAIRLSLEKGVTRGTGRGFGLWSAYEVLKANGGELALGSGGYQYNLSQNNVIISPRWQGTYFSLKYDIGNPVDYSLVTGLARDFTIKEDADDFPF